MELTHFENGLGRHYKDILEIIVRDGLYIKKEEGYCYTVGLASFDAPELIINTGSYEDAEVIFKALFEDVIAGKLLTEGYNLHRPFELPIKLSKSDKDKKKTFFSCRTFHGHWDFKTLKVNIDNSINKAGAT